MRTYKGYIKVFVCFASRAVHLEDSSRYFMTDFVLAFHLPVACRCKWVTLSSDCGTGTVIIQALANDGTE